MIRMGGVLAGLSSGGWLYRGVHRWSYHSGGSRPARPYLWPDEQLVPFQPEWTMGSRCTASWQQIQICKPQVNIYLVHIGGKVDHQSGEYFWIWSKLSPICSQKPNCKVRLVMVDGDWRVAINANKNIQANEELFYDYRYENLVIITNCLASYIMTKSSFFL